MPSRRSTFADPYEKWADLHPKLAARNLAQTARELDDLVTGRAQPNHPADTIEHRLGKARRWRDALRAVGACKRCGERLDGTGPEADLARRRGIGTTCWGRLTADEQERTNAWLARTADTDMEEPT